MKEKATVEFEVSQTQAQRRFEHGGYYYPETAAAALQAQCDPRLRSRNIRIRVSKPTEESKRIDEITQSTNVRLDLRYAADEKGTANLSDFWHVVNEKKEKAGLLQKVLTKGIKIFKY